MVQLLQTNEKYMTTINDGEFCITSSIKNYVTEFNLFLWL